MKIIHISDFHLNSFYKNSHLEEVKFILNYITKEKFDHLIITGDLTDNADAKDFEILRGLFRKNHLLNGEKLSLMIGNHDVYGGITTPDDLFTFHNKCEQINFHLRHNEFYLYFFETFEDCVYRKDYFPYAKLIENVLILGMNSLMEYSKVKNPFASNGNINLDQFNEIISILDEYSYLKNKIIFTHHHFNRIKSLKTNSLHNVWQNIEKQTLKLKRKNRLFKLFQKYDVDLVLHGHYHKSEEYFRKGLRFLNAGATISNNRVNTVQLNFIDILKDRINVEIRKVDMKNQKTIITSPPKMIKGFPETEIILQ